MRSRQIVFACFDVLFLALAWYATLHLRLFFNRLLPMQFTYRTLETVAAPLPVIVIIWMMAALWLRLYSKKTVASVWRCLASVVEAAVVTGSLIAVQAFLMRDFGVTQSRSFVVVFVPLSILTVDIGRFLAWLFAVSMQKRWGFTERVAMIGGIQEIHQRFRHLISGKGDFQLQFAGVILPEGNKAETSTDSIRVLGSTKRLAELINCEHLDRIIVVPDRLPERELADCVRTSRRMGVVMSHVIAAEPDSRIEFSAFSGLQLLDLRPVYFTRKQELAKLIFDWIAASIAVLLLSPALLVLAILVKFTSPGPLLYRSWRVGRGGRHFVFYKFRSMYRDADKKRAELAAQNQNSGHLFKIKNDPRITPLGRLMRRYSLDELPQLLNVLLGDMSLVGPRPLPSSDLAPDGSSNRFAAWAEQRSCVLPGITGLWQIRGRSELSFQEMMELDTYYIRSWSLKLDIQILLETPLVVLLGRGAY